MSFLSWFKELSTQSSGPPTVDNNHPRGLKTCRHTLSRFWNCETHGPGTRSQNSLHKWSFWFLQRTGQGGFLNKILIIFLIRFSQTQKVTTCVKRETSPKTWQWPEGTWKDALSISHQGDANQNPLRYHLTPTKTAIIKNNSKEAGDAAIKIHVPAFGVGIHSSSQAQISKNYWVMWWLLNLRNKTSRTILHSPQPWTRSAVSPHPHQDLFTVFLIPMSTQETCTKCSQQHHSQQVEITQRPVAYEWMNTLWSVHTMECLLFSHTQDWSTQHTCNMGNPENRLGERSRT